jgi:hypothetical protein
MVLLQKKLEYCNDWEGGTSGWIKGSDKLTKNDFAMKMVALVEAGNDTGYLVDVKREHDNKN